VTSLLAPGLPFRGWSLPGLSCAAPGKDYRAAAPRGESSGGWINEVQTAYHRSPPSHICGIGWLHWWRCMRVKIGTFRLFEEVETSPALRLSSRVRHARLRHRGKVGRKHTLLSTKPFLFQHQPRRVLHLRAAKAAFITCTSTTAHEVLAHNTVVNVLWTVSTCPEHRVDGTENSMAGLSPCR